MKTTNLLPVGSVVTIKDAEKKFLIIGLLPQTSDGVKDYIAVFYPEGYLDSEHFYMFDHSDIIDVKYLGYVDSEYQVFHARLTEILKNKE